MNYLAECEFARRGVSFTLSEAKIVMKFKGAQICVYAWAFFVLEICTCEKTFWQKIVVLQREIPLCVL